MALSAYRGGKLKKHALRGTSLAVDPKRHKERALFTDLHERAMTAGDQEAFKAQVAGEFSQRRERSLAAIAQGQGQIGDLSAEVADIESRRAGAQEDISKFQTRSLGLEKAMQQYKAPKKRGGFLKRLFGKMSKPKTWLKPHKLLSGGSRKDVDARALGDQGRHVDWRQNWLQKRDMWDDYNVFSKTLGATDAEQRFEGRRQAREAFGSDRYSKARQFNPRMIAYLADLKKREGAAQQYLPGTLEELANRRTSIGDLQSSIAETTATSQRRGGVYSGFFGGVA